MVNLAKLKIINVMLAILHVKHVFKVLQIVILVQFLFQNFIKMLVFKIVQMAISILKTSAVNVIKHVLNVIQAV